MFIINDLRLLDSLKDASYLLHEDCKYTVFSDIKPYQVSQDTIDARTLPLLQEPLSENEYNHFRINLKINNIKVFLLSTHSNNTDWINSIHNEGLSIITLPNIDYDLLRSELNIYKLKTFERLSQFQNQVMSTQSIQETLKLMQRTLQVDYILFDKLDHIAESNLGMPSIKINYNSMPTIKITKHLTIDSDRYTINEKCQSTLSLSIAEPDYFDYTLVIISNSEVSYIDINCLECVHYALYIEFLKETQNSSSHRDYRNEIFDNLLNGKLINHQDYNNAFNLFKLQTNKTYRCVTIALINSEDKSVLGHHNTLLKCIDDLSQVSTNIFFRLYENRITFLLEDTYHKTQSYELHHKLHGYNDDTIQVYMALSEPMDVYNINKVAIQSWQALKLLPIIKFSNKPIYFENLGFYRTFIEVNNTIVLQSLIPPLIKEIKEYNTDYHHTLKVFLEEQGSYSRCSKNLNIHPKTVRHRINHLTQKFDLELQHPQKNLSLQLAFAIEDFINFEIQL